MTHGPNTSNHHPLHPRDDRETLSALFDDELPGDAARFALKRLDHDADWRDTCGRWQLIGDALRGEATAAAPAHFSHGVMRMLAAEGHAAAPISPTPAETMLPRVAATRRRWLGGAALAASVAMAAVLVARPFSEPASTPVPAQVATGAAATVEAGRVAQRAEVAPPASRSSTPSVSAPTTLVADTARASRHRPTRPVRATSRPLRSPLDDSATVVAAAEQTSTQRPFHPPLDQIATRPWPRAVLPETGSGGFTVGFGATSAPASSLYPFEPRLPEAQTPKPAVPEQQH